MQNVVVPLNAFGRDEVLKNGQAAYIEHIAQAGAYGMEIRRELLPEELNLALDQIKQEITRFGLFTVYSAPIECWQEDHQLNTEDLNRVFQEAQTLNANWIKISLGHFQKDKSNVDDLAGFLAEQQGPQLLVENDQTSYGGNVASLKDFFKNSWEHGLPVQMTFDVGNWHYAGQSLEQAISELTPYVHYLHLKHVEKHEEGLVTLPLQKGQSWENTLKSFPAGITKALEFPIRPVEKIKDYLALIEEVSACKN